MKHKKILAALTAAALITTTTLPAAAADGLETATSHFGVTYQIDYNKGAANIGGKRIYFGYTANSPRVKAVGWHRAVELRAAELADLMTINPEWWAWYTAGKPAA